MRTVAGLSDDTAISTGLPPIMMSPPWPRMMPPERAIPGASRSDVLERLTARHRLRHDAHTTRPPGYDRIDFSNEGQARRHRRLSPRPGSRMSCLDGPDLDGHECRQVLEPLLGDQDDVLDPHRQVLVGNRNRRLDGEELARLERVAANGDVVHFHPESVSEAIARLAGLILRREPRRGLLDLRIGEREGVDDLPPSSAPASVATCVMVTPGVIDAISAW